MGSKGSLEALGSVESAPEGLMQGCKDTVPGDCNPLSIQELKSTPQAEYIGNAGKLGQLQGVLYMEGLVILGDSGVGEEKS